MSFTGLHGTPAFSSAASQCARVCAAHRLGDQRQQLRLVRHPRRAPGEARIGRPFGMAQHLRAARPQPVVAGRQADRPVGASRTPGRARSPRRRCRAAAARRRWRGGCSPGPRPNAPPSSNSEVSTRQPLPVMSRMRSAASAPMVQNMPVALSLIEAPQKVGGSSAGRSRSSSPP